MIKIEFIKIANQSADILTKALNRSKFKNYKSKLSLKSFKGIRNSN